MHWKIFILINKSNKLKEKGNKLTSGKESQKESRSKSQIKSDIKKNKLEEDVPKTEINNKAIYHQWEVVRVPPIKKVEWLQKVRNMW